MPQRGSAACLAHPTPGTRPGASACSCIIPCCICIKACITLGLVMACWKSGFCICLNANESQVFLISELVVIKGTHCLCLRHKEFWIMGIIFIAYEVFGNTSTSMTVSAFSYTTKPRMLKFPWDKKPSFTRRQCSRSMDILQKK